MMCGSVVDVLGQFGHMLHRLDLQIDACMFYPSGTVISRTVIFPCLHCCGRRMRPESTLSCALCLNKKIHVTFTRSVLSSNLVIIDETLRELSGLTQKLSTSVSCQGYPVQHVPTRVSTVDFSPWPSRPHTIRPQSPLTHDKTNSRCHPTQPCPPPCRWRAPIRTCKIISTG